MMKSLIIEIKMYKKILNSLILLPFLWLFSGFLLLKDGDKIMISMMIISILTSLLCYNSQIIKKNLKHNSFLLVMFITTAYLIFSFYYHGQSSRETRAYIGCSLFVLCFPRELLTEMLFRKLTLIGAILCFSFAFYYSTILKLDRGSWPIIAIPQADLSAVMLILSYTQIIYSRQKTQYIIATIALIFSITAIVLSDTRGVWLAICPALIYLFIKHYSSIKINWKVIFTSLIIASSLGFIMKNELHQRYEETRSEMVDITNGNLDTSFGLRLLMWKTTPNMIKGHYIIGSGDGYINRFDELYKEGLITKTLYNFQPAHFHNQYVDKLIKNGIIGLALLLALIIIPFWLANRKNDFYCNSVNGIIIVFAIAALTDVPFYYGHPLMMYLILIGTFTPMEKYNEKTHC